MNTMLTGGIAGVAAGLAFNRIAVFQVKQRTDDSGKIKSVNNIMAATASALISGILFAVIFRLYDSTPLRIECAAMTLMRLLPTSVK